VNKHTLFSMYLCTFLRIFFQLNMLICGVSMRSSDLRYLLDENCGAWKIGVDYVTEPYFQISIGQHQIVLPSSRQRLFAHLYRFVLSCRIVSCTSGIQNPHCRPTKYMSARRALSSVGGDLRSRIAPKKQDF
jgi:hypothetical protein